MQKILGFFLFCLMVTVNAQEVQDFSRLKEIPFLTKNMTPQEEMVTFTQSDHIRVSKEDKTIVLEGNAQIRRPDAILKGDKITYTQETGEVNAQGNTRLWMDGSLVQAPEVNYNLNHQSGKLLEPRYRLLSGGSGQAREAHIVDNNHLRLYDTQYSACQCEDKFWYIQSEQVDIFNDENEGIAKNGTLHIKGVPVLWSPYLSFPVKREKKTGLLAPTFSSTSRSGFGVSVPYFINLAPHYDMTVTPQVFSKRGVMLGTELRYIMPTYHGQWNGFFMPNDRVLDGRRRWSADIQHEHELGEIAGFQTKAMIDVQAASDGDYYRDFATLLTHQSDRTYLSKRISVQFTGHDYWSGYIAWQKYQGLHDFSKAQPIYYYQYEREPEIQLKAVRYDWHGFDIRFQNTFTRFTFPKNRYYNYASGERGGYIAKEGERYVSYTEISYPIMRPAWYITPKVGLHLSHYNTHWRPEYGVYGFRAQDGSQRPSVSRVVPLFSLDTGMVFERDTTLFGKAKRQTLEPRIYYVYIPFRSQAHLPIYDTAPSQFSMSSAFSENRYVGGWDRINDANQITLGLTSRWLDTQTGNERLLVQVAQRFYFQRPKVSLFNERIAQSSRSEILGNVAFALTDTLKTEAGVQFDTYQSKVAQTYASIRWFPQRLTSFSLTHRYQRDPFYNNEQQNPYAYQLKGKNHLSVAGQMPINENWYVVGRHDFSLKERRSTQSIVGVEYKGNCCWTGRVAFQRYAVSAEKTNTSVFFQLELKGLGSVGSDTLSLLRDSIPGYQAVRDPKPVQSPFERYEK